MTYETMDGREWASSDQASAHAAKLEKLQAFVDRYVGVIPLDELKRFCNKEAACPDS